MELPENACAGRHFRLVPDDMRLQNLPSKHNGRHHVQELGEGRKEGRRQAGRFEADPPRRVLEERGETG